MFSGGSKENIGKKWVNILVAQLISGQCFHHIPKVIKWEHCPRMVNPLDFKEEGGIKIC